MILATVIERLFTRPDAAGEAGGSTAPTAEPAGAATDFGKFGGGDEEKAPGVSPVSPKGSFRLDAFAIRPASWHD